MGTVYKVCPEHGMFEGTKCPLCKAEKDSRSKKYGGVTVIIPPHMRSGGK